MRTLLTLVTLLAAVAVTYAGSCSTSTLHTRGGTVGDGPGSYKPNAKCTWLVDPQFEPMDDRLFIYGKFTEFDTESTYDKVSVYDGGSKSAHPIYKDRSGKSRPGPFTTSGLQMFVTFSSDGSNQRAGFTLEYDTAIVASPIRCTYPQDVMIAIPTNSLVAGEYFLNIIRWAKDTVRSYRLGESAVKIGIVEYANSYVGRVVQGLTSDVTALDAALNNLVQRATDKNDVQEGLYLSQMELMGNGRSHVQKLVILFQTAKQTDEGDLIREATDVKAEGTTIIIAAKDASTHSLDSNEMAQTASDAEGIFVYPGWDDLLHRTLQRDLIYRGCFGGQIFCRGMMDIYMVVDGSGSVSSSDFSMTKTFMKHVFDGLDIDEHKVHVGIVQFAGHFKSRVETQLSGDKDALDGVVDRMIQINGGSTDIKEGIQKASLQLRQNARKDAAKVILLLTDGRQEHAGDPAQEADRARADGMTLFVVGVGSGVDEDELTAIANEPTSEHLFLLQYYSQLEERVNEVTKNACIQDNVPK